MEGEEKESVCEERRKIERKIERKTEGHPVRTQPHRRVPNSDMRGTSTHITENNKKRKVPCTRGEETHLA